MCRDSSSRARAGSASSSPIDLRERLAPNLDARPEGQVHFAPPAELAREDFLGAPAHAVREISAIDTQVVAIAIHPAAA
jgi:hypothetical protein